MESSKLFSVVFTVAWMLFIFYMSSFDSSVSASQSNLVVDTLCTLFKGFDKNLVSLIVRKFAHFTEYLILGMLCLNMIKKCGLKNCLAILICVLYAASDEIHQIFVPGRSCRVIDILLDSFGSISGIIIYDLNKK